MKGYLINVLEKINGKTSSAALIVFVAIGTGLLGLHLEFKYQVSRNVPFYESYYSQLNEVNKVNEIGKVNEVWSLAPKWKKYQPYIYETVSRPVEKHFR